MTRYLSRSCFILAVVAVSVAAGTAIAASGAGTVGANAKMGTPLPPGWELCVLAGLDAPASPANVADLNEWQAAEGGSTNNTAAYNPFNTARTTDVLGTPLPYATAAGGFPGFPDWLTGCSATVATLLQPNMWAITDALRAGDVSPPGDVPRRRRRHRVVCAPSSSGQPCYENAIAATGGSIPGVVAASTALNVYGNVQSDLQAYQLALAASAQAQSTQAVQTLQVRWERDGVTAARTASTHAAHQLAKFGVSEYVHSGLYQPSAFGTTTASESEAGVAAQQYTSVTADDLVARVHAASAALIAAQSRLADAQRELQSAAAAMLADDAAENHALGRLIADLATLQTAGACTTREHRCRAVRPVGLRAGIATGRRRRRTTTTTSTTPPAAPAGVTTTTTTAPSQTTTANSSATIAAPSNAPTGPPVGPPATTTTTAAPTTTTTSTITAQPPGSSGGVLRRRQRHRHRPR